MLYVKDKKLYGRILHGGILYGRASRIMTRRKTKYGKTLVSLLYGRTDFSINLIEMSNRSNCKSNCRTKCSGLNFSNILGKITPFEISRGSVFDRLVLLLIFFASINLTFCTMLHAEDNPFVINANQRDFQAQQRNKGKPYLNTESIQLPSNARELKSVTLTFQNLDGTQESRQLRIDKTIDWHYPIKITQQEAIRNISRRYFSLNDFEFYTEGKTFVINSQKHRILRHFILAEPTTIVVDFSRDNGNAYDGTIGTGEQYYSKVGVNSKSNLYRVSIELDGIYQYTLKSSKNTHTIQLR